MTPEHRVTTGDRLRALRLAISNNGFVRAIEAHSGLSAIVGETARSGIDGHAKQYDAIWESSLTDSASKGLPDASIVGIESRLHTISEILHVTTKPMIVDGDTGGEIPQFEYLIKHLESLGVSAVIIEDKVFPKRNSLDASAVHDLEDPEAFALKIQAGKRAALNDDFMVIARLEALIAGTGLKDALMRAEHYIQAGADGIMIHSNRREPEQLFQFARTYNSLCERLGRRPSLVSVPTTYNRYSDDNLVSHGFNIIIHANHLLRASHKAMKEVADRILETGSSNQADELCSPVKEIFSVVGFDKITTSDMERRAGLRLPVIIPAAGKDPVFGKQPKSLVQIWDRPILDYQIEAIHRAGLKQIVVVRGHEGQQFETYASDDNLIFCDHPHYAKTHALHSLMQARPHMGQGFVLIFSDILFDEEIIRRLVRSGKDIVLGIDSSYAYHKHDIDKRLDLVVTRKSFDSDLRSLRREPLVELVRIGKDVGLERADSEFTGMAYFSQEGAVSLQAVFDDAMPALDEAFHEAISFQQAGITDIMQELMDRGFPVYGLEVRQGWREIHTYKDVKIAETEMRSLASPNA